MYIDVKYKIGEVVYLLTDPENNMMIVTGYEIRSGAYIQYILSNSNNPEIYSTEIEITKEKKLHL